MTKSEDNASSTANRKIWEQAYWLVFGIGLLGIGYPLFYFKIAQKFFNPASHSFNDWATSIYFPEKKNELFAYIAVVASLFVYYATVRLVVSRMRDRCDGYFKRVTLSKKTFLAHSIPVFLINIPVLFIRYKFDFGKGIYLLFLVWFGLVTRPLWDRGNHNFADKVVRSLERVKTGLRLLILVVVAQLIFLFWPYLSGNFKMINEFLDIPEKTVLQSGIVDNTQDFYKGLIGFHKFDNIDGERCESFGEQIKVPFSPNVEVFLKLHGSKYDYDSRSGYLTVSGAVSDSEYTDLVGLVLPQATQTERERFADSYIQSRIREQTNVNRRYTSDEIEFLGKNIFEVKWQIYNRWVLHHHNFVLGPINEFALGKPISEIYTQYGRLNVYAMKFLLEKLGGISYQNYYRIWFSFYILYYLLFLGLLWFLFRDSTYVLIVMAASIGILNLIGHQFLFLGPGLNPIRHFFDLFVVFFLLNYLRRSKLIFLAGAGISVCMSILNNIQFGFCCLAGFLGVLLIEAIYERQSKKPAELAVAAITTICSLFAYRWTKSGFDPVFSYYLSGISGYPLARGWLICFLGASCFLYWALFNWTIKDRSLKYIAFFMTIYSQTMFVYCVWGGTLYHVLNISSVFVLTLVVVLKIAVDRNRALRSIPSLVLIAVMASFFASCLHYYRSKLEYLSEFQNHETYRWNLETAQFESTMDPKFFIPSIDLIAKYSQGRNGIFIISKYDYFLPFLAKKFSAMPFFDMAWFLLTQKEIDMAIESVNHSKPSYLFVDTEIERTHCGEIIDSNVIPFTYGTLHDESVQRVERLAGIRRVFSAVKEDYEPVEKTALLTVYKRKTSHLNASF